MAFVIPTTAPGMVNLHTVAHGSDTGFDRGTEGTGSLGTKTQGNLPLTSNAMQRTNTTTSSATGVLSALHKNFQTGGTAHNVATDTRVLIFTFQFNAPNRIQVSDVANKGITLTLGSGAASPPTQRKDFYVGGNDTLLGKSREQPRMIVIDLNDTSHDAGTGFVNTDVQTYGFGTVRFDIVGTSTCLTFYSRCWCLSTTKTSSDIPYFTGTSDWSQMPDLINGTDHTDIIGNEWLANEGGNVFTLAAPMRFGNNSTLTNFNDAGASVFWPDTNVASDPRVRVTEQAFRVYSYLTASDSLTLSGLYDCGNSFPPWDFENAGVSGASITLNGATFKRTGIFKMGAPVTGAATFDNCKLIDIVDNVADLDGSTFSNPNGTHLLSLTA